MRILVDTNIIISAGVFPKSNVGKVLSHIVNNHNVVLCQYTLSELKNIFKKKFPERIEYLNKFVKDLKYELIDIKKKIIIVIRKSGTFMIYLYWLMQLNQGLKYY